MNTGTTKDQIFVSNINKTASKRVTEHLNKNTMKLLTAGLRFHDHSMRHAEESICTFAETHRLENAPITTMDLDDFHKSPAAEAALAAFANSDWAILLNQPK